ncbi:MAG TPA: carbon monoxide dehydrogenase [Candidatus Latescibacteria bacterium]|nr:carbon monoxide dehydrogenase [Candidatus Latescibacterota bacterium]
MVIAISGKGGTGKTTVAALIIRELTADGPVLAVDADPNSNLGEQLGMEVEGTIGDIREEVLEELPPGMTKDRYLELRIQETLTEGKGVDLLTMGRPEGPGCYCYVNHLLRGFLDRLARNYGHVVIDNEAGMEHLSRRTTRDVDWLLVVSDPSVASLKAALRIRELSEKLKLGIRKKGLVLNRTDGELSPLQEEWAKRAGLEVVGTVPEDRTVVEYSLEGRPLVELPEDSTAARAISEIVRSLKEVRCRYRMP